MQLNRNYKVNLCIAYVSLFNLLSLNELKWIVDIFVASSINNYF